MSSSASNGGRPSSRCVIVRGGFRASAITSADGSTLTVSLQGGGVPHVSIDLPTNHPVRLLLPGGQVVVEFRPDGAVATAPAPDEPINARLIASAERHGPVMRAINGCYFQHKVVADVAVRGNVYFVILRLFAVGV